MTRRNRLTAIRLLAVIIAAYAVAPSFAQEGKRCDTPGRRCPRTAEGYRSVASDGHRQERQDFQEGLYESNGSGVRQTGKRQTRELDPRQFRRSVRVRGATGR
jgi:hypothetical protein